MLCLELAFTVERGEKEEIACEVLGRSGVWGALPMRGEGVLRDRSGEVVRGLGVMGRDFLRRRFWGRLLCFVSCWSLSFRYQ